ncbi:MAG: ATP-binding cassette domain-containing protein [Bacilli bacterium]
MIKIKNLSHQYNDSCVTLDDVTYDFKSCGLYIIKGKSGSGKSTFLKLILGLINQNEGSISVDNIEIKSKNNEDMSSYRLKNIGYIKQQVDDFGFLNIYDYLTLPSFFLKKKVNKLKIIKLLKYVGLNIKNKNVSSLSGGEKQRLQVVRALINDPKIILADEPTSALDEFHKKEIFRLLEKISKTKLVIVVTHENIEKYVNNFTLLKLENFKLIESRKNDNEVFIEEAKEYKKVLNKKNGIIKYNLKKMEAKPFRTSLSIVISSICLSLFACLINVVENAKNEVLNASSPLYKSNSLILSSKDNNAINYLSLSAEECNDLIKDSDAQNEYIGYFYDANFENVFKDGNDLFISRNDDLLRLSNFSVRSFNNFIYRSNLELKDFNEIGLSLTRSNLYSITNFLNIKNRITDLDSYLKENELLLKLFLKNEEYNYEEYFFFKLKYVEINDYSAILHNNYLFNEIFFDEFLCFPHVYETNTKLESINTLRKYTCVKFTNDNEKEKFRNSIKNPYIILENSCSLNPDYYRFQKHLIPFYSNNMTCNLKNDERFLDEHKCAILEGSNMGYYIDSKSGYSGFSGYMYLCKDEKTINEIVNYFDDANIEDHMSFKSNDNFVKGNILNLDNDNLMLRPIKQNLDLDEVVLSSYLKNKLNLSYGSNVYILYFINNNYYSIKLKVLDFIDEDMSVIYQESNWFNRIINEKFYLSILENIPVTCELFFNDELNDTMITNVQKNFYRFNVSTSSYDSYKSMNTFLSYLLAIIYFLFLIVLIINILILLFINKSIEIDSQIENESLEIMGLSQKDIIYSNLCRQLIISLFSFFQSIITLIFMNCFLKDKLIIAGISIFGNISIQLIFVILLYSMLIFVPFIIKAVYSYKKMVINKKKC